MVQIQNTVVSLDVIQKKFACDLNVCKGKCCVIGDSGAPLLPEEAKKLEEIYPQVKPFLRPEGVATIEQKGIHMVDFEGDTVTPLVGNAEECAYVVFKNDIALCGIEIAYNAGAIDFIKPLSCHLFPVRIKKYKKFEAVNYEEWDICKCALKHGKQQNVTVYQTCKTSLERMYGSAWFTELQEVAQSDELQTL